MLKHLQQREDWSEKSLGAKGFTLIELLVVVVILGILAAVVVFSVQGFTDDAQENACATESRTLATAVETYYAQHRALPGSIAQLEGAGLIRPGTATNYTIAAGGVITPGGDCV